MRRGKRGGRARAERGDIAIHHEEHAPVVDRNLRLRECVRQASDRTARDDKARRAAGDLDGNAGGAAHAMACAALSADCPQELQRGNHRKSQAREGHAPKAKQPRRMPRLLQVTPRGFEPLFYP